MPRPTKQPFSIDALNNHIRYIKQLSPESRELNEIFSLLNNGVSYYLLRIFEFSTWQRRYLTAFRDKIISNTDKIIRALRDRNSNFIVMTQDAYFASNDDIALEVVYNSNARIHTCKIEKIPGKSWFMVNSVNSMLNVIKQLPRNRKQRVLGRISSDIIRFLKDTFVFDSLQEQELTRRRDNIRNITSDIITALRSSKNFIYEEIRIPKPRPNPYPEEYRALKIEVVLDQSRDVYVCRVEKFR